MVFVQIRDFSDYIWEKRIEEIYKRLKVDSALLRPVHLLTPGQTRSSDGHNSKSLSSPDFQYKLLLFIYRN